MQEKNLANPMIQTYNSSTCVFLPVRMPSLQGFSFISAITFHLLVANTQGRPAAITKIITIVTGNVYDHSLFQSRVDIDWVASSNSWNFFCTKNPLIWIIQRIDQKLIVTEKNFWYRSKRNSEKCSVIACWGVHSDNYTYNFF